MNYQDMGLYKHTWLKSSKLLTIGSRGHNQNVNWKKETVPEVENSKAWTSTSQSKDSHMPHNQENCLIFYLNPTLIY